MQCCAYFSVKLSIVHHTHINCFLILYVFLRNFQDIIIRQPEMCLIYVLLVNTLASAVHPARYVPLVGSVHLGQLPARVVPLVDMVLHLGCHLVLAVLFTRTPLSLAKPCAPVASLLLNSEQLSANQVMLSNSNAFFP